tara:strand:+ start:392 stop:1036 length:645 start_codon:yes stop_codon:yes gene_type:complete
MIIQCESCSRKFVVKDNDIPTKGRMVQCGYCSVTWHQMPIATTIKNEKKIKTSKPIIEKDDSPSVDSIKASDGKTYRFLGSQWAELLPSGKTGLFARKKISKELDELTGRKEKKIIKKKKRKITEVDPSEGVGNQKQLPDIYKPKEGLGFFGYIFLIIIIGFSVVGVLKTFENDLLNLYPEAEFIFEKLNEQLVYVSESVKNIVVIVSDLINSY